MGDSPNTSHLNDEGAKFVTQLFYQNNGILPFYVSAKGNH